MMTGGLSVSLRMPRIFSNTKKPLRPGSIWVGWLVELRYRTGQKSEARSYGPDEKVLVRMRVLERLLIKEDLHE